MNEVVVVLYKNPTAAGPILKAVYRHYGDAELFVQRQSDPEQYVLTVVQVVQ